MGWNRKFAEIRPSWYPCQNPCDLCDRKSQRVCKKLYKSYEKGDMAFKGIDGNIHIHHKK